MLTENYADKIGETDEYKWFMYSKIENEKPTYFISYLDINKILCNEYLLGYDEIAKLVENALCTNLNLINLVVLNYQ